MEEWLKITLLLCVFGVLKETRPSEPFITKYLTTPPMYFSLDQVIQDIYPVSIYAMLILSVVIFLITDLLCYKPVIILLSVSAAVTYLMLIFGRTLLVMQILEVTYALFSVCEVAYYTYIYAKVDKSHYQEVTGYTRAAYLTGRAVSGLLSQGLVSWGFSYSSLNYVTLVAMCLSGVWAVFLPPVKSSIYFNPASNKSTSVETTSTTRARGKINNGFSRLWDDFISAFKQPYVLKWAFWWALATCCYYQILQYIQSIWEQILKENPQNHGEWNGLVETAYTLTSAAGVYFVGKIEADWKKYGELVLCIGSILLAGIIFYISQTTSIVAAYVLYVLYAVIYNCVMTISNCEVAKNINPESYGLIFGFTTTVALLMESLLTIIVVENSGLSLRSQFVVYGGYFAFLGIVFAVKSAIDLIKGSRTASRDIEHLETPTS